ncbi:MAG: cyclic nucleotide-binding domain-containing protein [Elusimicrobia bacterium]|nr:cyclic nucleotide-binding domain-containing protein [Elusimicrobiota bacterium]
MIEQEETDKDIYVLCSGQVAITKIFGSAGVTLAALEPGAVFGEMALVSGGVRVASAVAQSKCEVYRIVAEDLEAVLKDRPQLLSKIQGLAAQRR